mgnify:CR=1 FL=1
MLKARAEKATRGADRADVESAREGKRKRGGGKEAAAINGGGEKRKRR